MVSFGTATAVRGEVFEFRVVIRVVIRVVPT